MKKVKRLFSLLLVVCLLVGMTGCAGMGKPVGKQEDREALWALLDQVAENIKEGAPPITMQLTADFVSWACSTGMTQKEALQAASDWLSQQSPSIRLAAEDTLNAMMEELGKLLKDGTETVKSWDIQSILDEILSSGGVD